MTTYLVTYSEDKKVIEKCIKADYYWYIKDGIRFYNCLVINHYDWHDNIVDTVPRHSSIVIFNERKD